MQKAICLSLVLLLSLPAFVPAQQPQFFRIKEEKNQPAALEIAVTRYTNRSKTVTVDLVGVVHIADRAYYDRLNKRLADYDAVLYELVAPPGTRVPRGGKGGGLSSWVTGMMSSVLDLDSQLVCIDYHKKNFVHADLSFPDMMAAARARGETEWTLGLSIFTDMLRQQNASAQKQGQVPGESMDMLTAMLNPSLFRRAMARQLVQTADMGPTLHTLLVTDRNKKACTVLADEISDGKTRLAIFYGAAHMPDFDRRMREEFGLRRQGQEWLTAWDLRDRSADTGNRLKSLFEKALEDR